jgi:hypothetical protein
MTRTNSTAEPDADREGLTLAPGFPPRAALLVEASLAACAARGVPRPRARLWLEAVPTSVLGSALGRCHEAADDGAGRPAIRIQLASPALTRRDRSRLRVQFGLHTLLHEYAHALDQELADAPDDAGVWGRFGRYTRRAEWRELFVAHRARRLPYLSPQGRGSIEEFFAEAFVAYVARPNLLWKGGQPVVTALEAALGGGAPRPACGPPR